jgi:hypothetical protein
MDDREGSDGFGSGPLPIKVDRNKKTLRWRATGEIFQEAGEILHDFKVACQSRLLKTSSCPSAAPCAKLGIWNDCGSGSD